ncbi:MerR family transcriptional regulator [Streptomyces zagrosensis]|uniref:DNA-binding transcriptional MerR regulator n=1 Tax=Streptomyces zagrosensis TaxID=1042984 RepID=A0A7W9QES1_9ACTN|nr:MerR family transcriptional regulator [Streptomyces zagrosensis]MBB5938935.1 DNA-binding transcriptional MerR regulator [Streptomyces zagrosensis]
MTDVTSQGAALGIGDLAQLTGVPVRTIRFYCDGGLLVPRRSVGGHRRFDPAAVDQLRLIRQLRRLGLGLAALRDVLAGRCSLTDAVAAERAALDAELAALSWRHAWLRAVEDAGPIERAAHLELLGVVESGPAARDALVAFWRRLFLAPLPDDMVSMFLDVSVPTLPADPTPHQVVAYAQLAALVTDRSLERQLLARAKDGREAFVDEVALLTGVGEAYEMAGPLLLARRRPGPGPALDRFVEAHASVRNSRDTAAFRREMLTAFEHQSWTHIAVLGDPRIRRYWGLVSEVTGDAATLGALHAWLLDALERSIE